MHSSEPFREAFPESRRERRRIIHVNEAEIFWYPIAGNITLCAIGMGVAFRQPSLKFFNVEFGDLNLLG